MYLICLSNKVRFIEIQFGIEKLLKYDNYGENNNRVVLIITRTFKKCYKNVRFKESYS